MRHASPDLHRLSVGERHKLRNRICIRVTIEFDAAENECSIIEKIEREVHGRLFDEMLHAQNSHRSCFRQARVEHDVDLDQF